MGGKNIVRLLKAGLVAGDTPFDLAAGEKLTFRPQADDTGTIAFGDGTTDADVKVFVGASTDFALFDVGNGQLTLDSMELQLGDSDEIEFGDATSGDVTMAWDGTDFDILAAADDSVIKFGTGTNSFDIWQYGNIAGAYTLWDASANVSALVGPVRPRGWNAPSDRFELKWVAGSRGKPGLNAEIQTTAESTREIADPDFENIGTNATTALVTYGVEGGIILTTAAGSADQAILIPHTDTSQTAWRQVTWGSDRSTSWECHIATNAVITSSIIWAGLKLTEATGVIATDDDQVFFRYEAGIASGVWQIADSIAGTDVTTNSSVTVAVSTEYHLKIDIDSSRVAKCYINGVLERTTSALTTAKDFVPQIAVQTSTTAARAIGVYSQAISRTVATPA